MPQGFGGGLDRALRPPAGRAQRQFARAASAATTARGGRGRSRRQDPADRRWRRRPRSGWNRRSSRSRAARCGCCVRAASRPRSSRRRPALPLLQRRRGAGIEAPGMLASHYAPGAAVRVGATMSCPARRCSPSDTQRAAGFEKAVAMLNLSPSGDLREAAANLFSYLQALDRSGAQTIAVEPIPHTGLGEAINDRLSRAAAPRDNTSGRRPHDRADRSRPARPFRGDRRRAPTRCAPRPTSRPTCTSCAASIPAARRWC